MNTTWLAVTDANEGTSTTAIAAPPEPIGERLSSAPLISDARDVTSIGHVRHYDIGARAIGGKAGPTAGEYTATADSSHLVLEPSSHGLSSSAISTLGLYDPFASVQYACVLYRCPAVMRPWI
jgi:hypothetical protein